MKTSETFKPKPVMFRPPPELSKWLAEEAKKNMRSVSAQANWALQAYRDQQLVTQQATQQGAAK